MATSTMPCSPHFGVTARSAGRRPDGSHVSIYCPPDGGVFSGGDFGRITALWIAALCARGCWTRPGSEHDGDLARASHLTACPRDRRVRGEAERRDALKPRVDRDAKLHTGEVRAGAAVDSEAECDVAVLG